ncbi:MAG: hypothetical protein GC149_15975 [Gammaproteobacteria bacterium]|nr:hypothetical protein [Gammaproteobacteria bacterium]
MARVVEQFNERRTFPRFSVTARMRVSHSRIGTIEGYSVNISDTGLMLRCSDLPKLPRGAHIGLQMLDSANPGIIFNTRVIHMSESEIGLAIVDYEYNGVRYTLDELRRQWDISRHDLSTGNLTQPRLK